MHPSDPQFAQILCDLIHRLIFGIYLGSGGLVGERGASHAAAKVICVTGTPVARC